MNILFMGTPDFAQGVLQKLVEDGKHKVVCVVTQPDRAKGRSDKLIPSPVKSYATEQGIEVFQPEKIKTPEAVEELKKYNADIFVVAAFGQILSEEILNMPKYGCINVHASLLPKYRGAAPIQWAIADGLSETGVTIMQMDKGLDTGDIISVSTVEITNEETGETLFDKLMYKGAELLADTLVAIENGTATRRKQNEDEATYAKILKKEMGCIDFNKTAREIDCLIRAFTPWPGAYTYLDGKLLKIKKAVPVEGNYVGQLGEIVDVTRDELVVACGKDYLSVSYIQAEGKKAMSVHDFLLGKKLETGTKLG